MHSTIPLVWQLHHPDYGLCIPRQVAQLIGFIGFHWSTALKCFEHVGSWSKRLSIVPLFSLLNVFLLPRSNVDIRLAFYSAGTSVAGRKGGQFGSHRNECVRLSMLADRFISGKSLGWTSKLQVATCHVPLFDPMAGHLTLETVQTMVRPSADTPMIPLRFLRAGGFKMLSLLCHCRFGTATVQGYQMLKSLRSLLFQHNGDFGGVPSRILGFVPEILKCDVDSVWSVYCPETLWQKYS